MFKIKVFYEGETIAIRERFEYSSLFRIMNNKNVRVLKDREGLFYDNGLNTAKEYSPEVITERLMNSKHSLTIFKELFKKKEFLELQENRPDLFV